MLVGIRSQALLPPGVRYDKPSLDRRWFRGDPKSKGRRDGLPAAIQASCAAVYLSSRRLDRRDDDDGESTNP